MSCNYQIVIPEFIHEGGICCCPIPRDSINIKSIEFDLLKAWDKTKKILFLKTKEYDQSSEAQEMMRAEGYSGFFTHISIPFSSSSPIRGAYLCIIDASSPPSNLVFTFSCAKGVKISKTYDFPEVSGCQWYFLPIDLSDVFLCEITGKGREKRYFRIYSLVFIREETPDEIMVHEVKEKLWSETAVVKAEFIQEGDDESFGRYSIPIPRDDPKLVIPSLSMVKCKDDSKSKESMFYDKYIEAQKMLEGERFVFFSELSIPFGVPCPMKGAYICVHKDFSSPSLLFTFTDSDGKKINKKYEFTRPIHEYECHFLPIDLDNVVLCEIEGKGMWLWKNSRRFCIYSLVFLRGDDIPISPPLLTRVPSKEEEEYSIQMSSSTDVFIQTVEPKFIHEGFERCCPIPGDAPNIKSAEFPTINAIDGTKEEGAEKYDQSYSAQWLMKGWNDGCFTHISIPFSSSSPMKGAYICLSNNYPSPPSHLIFTLTSSKGDKTAMKYEFPEFKGFHWYFLPVDLPDVVLCEITGKGRENEYFRIIYLVFIREETPEEIKSREAREKLWSEAPVVKPEFVKEGDEESKGRDSIPIPHDDPKLVDPSFSMVKCKNDSVNKESEEYDQSSDAQKMLKGEDYVYLSHLSVPFIVPCPMKGAYICVHKDFSSPSLLFTFTDSDGKKINKKYEFTRPKYWYEWHFLPIDLDNVVLCDDIPISPPLLTPVPSSSSKEQTSKFCPSVSFEAENTLKREEEEELPLEEEKG
ncbi:hypothetical protein ADUPG1_012741 [Aduncisulcus paluster]|uniref:Uncharacterized protein n=1 Tax=Aduncisulcus paluster TaxID=2918883 RepID=A0ABQ5K0G9_9EUKA|nr:hypothetical protein ADUPG1_012741 [Aduncisulcus paluster]